MRVLLLDPLVVGVQQPHDIDRGATEVVDVHGATAAEPDGDRADVLAVVASVDPVADRRPELGGDRPRLLQDPRQAAPAVDHPGGDDRPGGTAVEALPAGSTPVGDVGGGRLVLGGGDDRTQDEPAADTGEEQIGVLAVPAEAGAVRHSTVDDRVVVGEGNGTVIGAPDGTGDVA